MVLMPIKAIDGSNNPEEELVIPVPVQMPGSAEDTKSIGASLGQKGPAELMFTGVGVSIETGRVKVAVQLFWVN